VILFWVICGALILLALAFVLPTALDRSAESESTGEEERRNANIAVYRDQLAELESDLQNGIVGQEQYALDRDEIERRLLEDITAANEKAKPAATGGRSTAYAIAIGLPVAAVMLYLSIGNPQSIDNTKTPASNNMASAPAGRTQEQIEANVAALAKRLQENPSDAQGWTMLARSYSSMQRYGESAGAYARATELTPNDADLWAEYAFVSAMASGRSLEGRPMEFLDRALKIDPENAKALQLAGSAAFQAQDYKKAIDYWERVLKRVPPDSEVAESLTENINEAKRLAAGK
jgi:cytochrome c-type biogenesis protein CcmH